MKKFFYMAVAAIAALSSCSQDELFNNESNEVQNGSFTATIENPSTTRTTIDGKNAEGKYPVLWVAGDEVSINGVSYKAATGGSSSTTLNPTGTEATPNADGKYVAYYPTSLATDFSVPAVQTYENGTNKDLPMMAESANKNLSFTNLCGVLAVTVTPNATDNSLSKIKSITISADESMSGEMNSESYGLKDNSDPSRTVCLNMGEGVSITEATTFHIAIPVGFYNNLKITVSDGSRGYYLTTSKANIEVKRGNLYPINFQNYSKTPDYLCLTALEDESKVWFASLGVADDKLKYSTDNGGSWDYVTSIRKDKDNAFNLSKGQSVWFRGENNEQLNVSAATQFAMSGKIEASGNIMSLLDGNSPSTTMDDTKNALAFCALFEDCISLVSAGNLYLPATKLATSCYDSMFKGCTNLTTAPTLPATELAEYCYDSMFAGCSALTTAPALPATKLVKYCYQGMFYNCTKLTTAPALPATELADHCYADMFGHCTNLTTAPALPATTLVQYCYDGMFLGCTNLATAPALPATKLAEYCYTSMFEGCTNLTTAPALPATTLAFHCYQNMFYNCTSLATAPTLPATKLANSCYNNMFSGCTKLTTAPTLPATDLASFCYQNMFKGCTKLTTASALPATTLKEACYYSMFEGCTDLTTAPTLPATTLAHSCYHSMFSGCLDLVTAPALPATSLETSCYNEMFKDCMSLTTAPTLSATTLAGYCYKNMFNYCIKLSSVKMLATDINATECLNGWLEDAGKYATNLTLTVANGMKDKMDSYKYNFTVKEAE